MDKKSISTEVARQRRLSYKVTVLDDEENKLEKKFDCRAKALDFARANKYSQINALYL